MNDFEFPSDLLLQKRGELAGAVGKGQLLEIMCRNTIARIRQSKTSYLFFGPYWWSVKNILSDNGYMLGETTNEYFAGRFNQSSPELTLIAAWEAADYIQSNFFAGTRDFDLGNDEAFSLFDPDMEQGA